MSIYFANILHKNKRISLNDSIFLSLATIKHVCHWARSSTTVIQFLYLQPQGSILAEYTSSPYPSVTTTITLDHFLQAGYYLSTTHKSHYF